MKLYTLILILILAGACHSTLLKDKNAVQEKHNKTASNTMQEPPSSAHIRGEILSNSTHNNENSCDWVLKIDLDSINLLDPVNLSKDFQHNGIKVWVYYSGMRRMNRCPEASPVWVQDMVLRL